MFRERGVEKGKRTKGVCKGFIDGWTWNLSQVNGELRT